MRDEREEGDSQKSANPFQPLPLVLGVVLSLAQDTLVNTRLCSSMPSNSVAVLFIVELQEMYVKYLCGYCNETENNTG